MHVPKWNSYIPILLQHKEAKILAPEVLEEDLNYQDQLWDAHLRGSLKIQIVG